MTTSRPQGLEFKAAVLAAPAPEVGAPVGGSTRVDPAGATVELIASVTGVPDDVGDIVMPGAFAASLHRRQPKVVLGHDWNRPIGRVLRVRELRPGDPGLPARSANGAPWPREAGALVVLAEMNTQIKDARDALSNIRFFGADAQFSIGYKTVRSSPRPGGRKLHEVDLFEVSPVLHGAHRLTGVLGKSGRPAGMETKAVPLRVRGPLGGRAVTLERCAVCGQVAGLASTSTVRGTSRICPDCVDQVPHLLDDLTVPDPTPEQVYDGVLRGEQAWHTGRDGTMQRGPRDIRRP